MSETTSGDRQLPTSWDQIDAHVEERLAEVRAELQASEARADELNATVQILHALEYPVARISTENAFVFLNNAFMESAELEEESLGSLFGTKENYIDRYTGQDITQFIEDSDRERFESLKLAARESYENNSGNTFKLGVMDDLTFVTKQGNTIPYRVNMTYSRLFQAYQVSFIDITDELAAQAELKAAHGEMEQRVEEQTEEIRAQADAILEISTPVISLWDGILLLPIIGTLETSRAAQMSEDFLRAVEEQEAKVAIMDVTGVSTIDTSVARHLLSTVQAAGVLGAQVIVTGFSPESAQTLIHLGVDFAALRTRGSLRAGIAEALALIGQHVSD